jgi:hypothetical protein
MIRPAKISDIETIVGLEKKYYDGYSLSEEILEKWIKNGNYYVLEENSMIVGSIYFEFIEEIKGLPWQHEPINGVGNYVYISEIAVDSKDKIPVLFQKVLDSAKENNCKGIVWLTGEKSNHDKIEREFLQSYGFIKFEDVKNWECAPNYFVDDHALWLMKMVQKIVGN